MTTTTVQAQPDIVSDTLADYSAFYALTNDYAEPVRPSLDDVVKVSETVKSQLGLAVGQNYWESATVAGVPWAGQSTVGGMYARTFRLGISPGIISCRSVDLDKQAATEEAQKDAARRNVDLLASQVDPETGELLDENGKPTREIWEWSRSSRALMTKTLASLDYSTWGREDGALGMVTLTLPGNWKPLAPDGATFKKLVRKFEHRFRRVVGPWRLLWKLEFQDRGAPHWHALMRIPALVTSDGGYGPTYAANESNGWQGITETFESWLARTWAFVCDASRDIDTIGKWIRTPDGWEIDETYMEHRSQPEDSEFARHWRGGTGVDFSGQEFSDPRRISMYFAGHSAKSQDGKEYQHKVPGKWRRPGAGPGRFWGYCGLDKALVEIELSQRDFDRVRREFRKLARARSWEIAVKRAKGAATRNGMAPPAVAAIRAPKLARSRYGGNGGQNGGWVLLNDALAVVSQLARFLGDDSCPAGCSWCGAVEPSHKSSRKPWVSVERQFS